MRADQGDVKKIVISGEGEPMTDMRAILDVIALLDAKTLHLVTSGSVSSRYSVSARARSARTST